MRLTAVVLTLVATNGVDAQVRQVQEPIIDMHLHAFPIRRSPDGLPRQRPCINNNPVCSNPPSTTASDSALLAGTIAEMRRHGVILAFVSGGSGRVLEWSATAPELFFPSILFGGTATLPSLDSLRRLYASGRLKGMGEITSQYGGFAPTDPRLAPYFALADSLDIPVLIHTTGMGQPGGQFRSALGRPLLLEEILIRHPRLRLSVENAGYPFLDEMTALMSQYPEVYADVSTITWIIPRAAFHAYLEKLVTSGFGDRLMFGSDQMQWPETIGMAIEAIQSASFLTHQQKRAILHDNAARFLRLEPRGGKR